SSGSGIFPLLNHLGLELKNVKSLAEHIGEGHFDEAIAAFEHSSDLGASLASMRSSLHEVAEEDRRRLWVNEGYAQVAHTLRSNNDNLQNLCDEVLHLIVKYLDCNQGALYLKEGEEGSEVMEVKALYAYNKKKFDEIEVAYGEGLVGQVWRDEDELYLTDVPNDYVRIRSGLGGAEPNSLFLVPMMASQKIVGILEVASFHTITPHQKDFVQRACEAIATAVGNVKMNERTLLLLKSSQEQAEELRAQEEEMRQNMEELQSTQEEMFRAQRELQAKERNLDGVINNTTDTIFAIDTNYCITVVNKFLRDKYAQMGINLQLGTNILDLLKGEARANWKDRYDRALGGERYQLIEERTTDDGSLAFAQTFHNPIKDSAGQVVGVSVISRDVTDLMKAEAEAKSKEVTLNALINSTDDTYFAIDLEYRILVANKTLRDRFRAGGVSLEEGDLIFDKLPEDQHDKWKERYQRIFAGERFIIEEERRVKNSVLYIQGHYIPIFNEDEKVVGGIVMSKDITDVQQALAEKEQRDQEIEKLRKQIGLEAAEAMVGNGHSGNGNGHHGNGNGKKSPRSKLEAKLQNDPKK
ncbi:MAG: PAS domain-containing protein, partial [Bacteroidota bacterium]